MVGLGSSAGSSPEGVCGLATGAVAREAPGAGADRRQEGPDGEDSKLVPSKEKEAKQHLGACPKVALMEDA